MFETDLKTPKSELFTDANRGENKRGVNENKKYKICVRIDSISHSIGSEKCLEGKI